MNISLASSASQLPIPAPQTPVGHRNTTKKPLRSNSLRSEFETITIQKGKFRQLVEALAASVQLLQEGVGTSHELLDPESSPEYNRDSIVDSIEEIGGEFLNIKKKTPEVIRHGDEIRDGVFKKGYLPFILSPL